MTKFQQVAFLDIQHSKKSFEESTLGICFKDPSYLVSHGEDVTKKNDETSRYPCRESCKDVFKNIFDDTL